MLWNIHVHFDFLSVVTFFLVVTAPMRHVESPATLVFLVVRVALVVFMVVTLGQIHIDFDPTLSMSVSMRQLGCIDVNFDSAVSLLIK